MLACARHRIDGGRGLVPVPLAPSAVLGQLAVRGEFLPVLDLGALLGVEAAPASTGVALVMAAGPYALRADDVVDFWEAEAVRVRPMPAGGDPRGVLRGVAQRAQEVAGLVDASALHGVAVATLRASSTP